MKQAWQRLVRGNETGEKFHILSTVVMIFLFLTFWGVSFYVLLNSFA